MDFTYDRYSYLVGLLRRHGYQFAGYDDEERFARVVIMRHDVDFCLHKALAMAELEFELGVKATYFVLVSTDFYNVFSATSYAVLKRIIELGHEVGLHFDEQRYPGASIDEVQEAIGREAGILTAAQGCTVRSVSMHRPSREMLQSNMQIPGLVNSYSKRFFSDYKYVSDSRMHWREDVCSTVSRQEFDRLHILTHPFWYAEAKETTKQKLLHFIEAAGSARKDAMANNFTALDEILARVE